MRLSEAIRLGAMLRPQNFGGFFGIANDGTIVKSCALGAAGEAAGLLPMWGRGEFDACLEDEFPVLRSMVTYNGDPCWHLLGAIAFRNDDEHLTREQIADWVETVEAAQAVRCETEVAHA